MENIKELLDELKSEIINELPEALAPTIEGTVENIVHSILDDYLEEEIENAITNVMQGLNDDETAKDRLYILSQDNKLLAPLFSAEVHSANSKNPKSIEFPFVITVRSGVTSNNVFGWYKDEESAKAELKNIYNALKFSEKDQYAVYEMK